MAAVLTGHSCLLARRPKYFAPHFAASTMFCTACATDERNWHISGIELLAHSVRLLPPVAPTDRLRPLPPRSTMRATTSHTTSLGQQDKQTDMLAVVHGSHVPLH